jgi:hypothetical protein
MSTLYIIAASCPDHWLPEVWESEMRDQGARAITHKQGDLLWRDKVGWRFASKKSRIAQGRRSRSDSRVLKKR